LTSRLAWLVLLAYVVVWDVYAGLSGKHTLTSEFRRTVADTHLRWPAMVLALLLLLHLFLPVSLRRYDPIDRLYYRVTDQQNPYTSPPGS
jgi:hypothetical protein